MSTTHHTCIYSHLTHPNISSHNSATTVRNSDIWLRQEFKATNLMLITNNAYGALLPKQIDIKAICLYIYNIEIGAPMFFVSSAIGAFAPLLLWLNRPCRYMLPDRDIWLSQNRQSVALSKIRRPFHMCWENLNALRRYLTFVDDEVTMVGQQSGFRFGAPSSSSTCRCIYSICNGHLVNIHRHIHSRSHSLCRDDRNFLRFIYMQLHWYNNTIHMVHLLPSGRFATSATTSYWDCGRWWCHIQSSRRDTTIELCVGHRVCVWDIAILHPRHRFIAVHSISPSDGDLNFRICWTRIMWCHIDWTEGINGFLRVVVMCIKGFDLEVRWENK